MVRTRAAAFRSASKSCPGDEEEEEEEEEEEVVDDDDRVEVLEGIGC